MLVKLSVCLPKSHVHFEHIDKVSLPRILRDEECLTFVLKKRFFLHVFEGSADFFIDRAIDCDFSPFVAVWVLVNRIQEDLWNHH